jgi:hypothetical protein
LAGGRAALYETNWPPELFPLIDKDSPTGVKGLMSTRPQECGSCGKDHASSRPCPKPKKHWRHTSGGTVFNDSKFPCDDSYKNTRTKEVVYVFSTPKAHFKMPARVRKPSDLIRRAGVSKKVVRIPQKED